MARWPLLRGFNLVHQESHVCTTFKSCLIVLIDRKHSESARIESPLDVINFVQLSYASFDNSIQKKNRKNRKNLSDVMQTL